MKAYIYQLTSKNKELLNNEILFALTSAKALNSDLVRLNFPHNASDTCIANIARLLRTAKRNGYLQLYISPADIENNSTEAEYVRNKHPELLLLDRAEKCFLVRI